MSAANPTPSANILIVDDQDAKRLALAAALSPLGQNIVMASSGREALRLLLQDEYAVILLDVRMPDMDGFETASLIRSRKQTEGTPIIFVTAYDRAEADMLGGYSLGAVDFIFSPVQAEVLRAKVSVFVDLHLKTLMVQAHERRLRELEAQQARAAQDRLRRANERERMRAQQEMRKLSSAVEQAADPIFIADREGVIEYVNPAFERVTGYARDEAIGQHASILWPEGVGQVFTQEVWPALLRGETYRGDVMNRRKDGSLYHKEKTLTPIKDERGRITHVVSTGKDVSDRKRIEAELVALNLSLEARVESRTAQLEDVNRELEAFAYSISHDLRTPLRHIASFADLLSRDTQGLLPEKATRRLTIIQESAKRMDGLINDLLEFARTGRQDLVFREVPLGSVVQEVMQDVERANEGRVIEWDVQDLPTVYGDPAALRQVLMNLVANAVKYARDRTPIRVALWGETGAREDVVHVRDNGVGFNMAYAHKLFGVFQRLHSPDSFEGTGVGLANVKRIVARHGGRVWAEGTEGQGATFSFSLPREETTGPRVPVAATASSEA
ncbi:sensor histidine kinase [Deinococcus maricopensis]|uniref:histidine kinase n=1 Tax=Deinococcus maricopensis (strain DSM 21211 / LMG 22137 / NRRL B-23946 / LB-34) TaxID=709986 RepID=E8U9X5_DEIML|nr:ATP-binding protein [Deinococcus maricopensis]ADV67864.1 multi-sensor signal transduction histidine kinase [Deinococcus maricopensis DSM 21211]